MKSKKLLGGVFIEHGHDFFWKTILRLDKEGEWSVPDILRCAMADKATIRDFVMRLVRAKYAKPTGLNGAVKLYRLIKFQSDAPRLRRDGTELPEKKSDTLWRTMKMLKTFTFAELENAASTDTQLIKAETVIRYIKYLKAAGIVGVVENCTTKRPWRFRLQHNLGVKAPQILKSKLIYDPNADAIYGQAKILEDVE